MSDTKGPNLNGSTRTETSKRKRGKKDVSSKTIKAAAKTAVKQTAKAATRTSSKATTTRSSTKASTHGSAKTASHSSDKLPSNSSFMLTPNGCTKRAAKRKNNKTSIPGSTAKRAKVSGTPGTTPRRKQGQRVLKKSGQRIKKGTPIKFDYGVPSPIETERESIDEDSPKQGLAKAAQRVVVAKTKKGQSVRITLHSSRAFTFKNEQARKLWETATKERADLIKGEIEKRDFVPDWMKRQLEASLEFTASQRQNMLTENKNRRSQGMLKWLKLEEKALDLNAEVKSSLRKDYANTDLEKCIACLEKLLQLPIDPLTLKKYPDLAMTPCILQKYKGALTQWTLSSQEKELFCTKREIIREKAKALQQKYMELFGIEDDTKYAEIFKQRLQVFQDSVSNLTENQISLIVHDPLSKKVRRKNVSSPN